MPILQANSLLSERLSPGVFRIPLFPGIKYEMHGTGYCSAAHREVNTPVVAVDGNEGGANELVLAFPDPECPKKPSEGDKP